MLFRSGAPDYVFDGKATKEHVQNFPKDYLNFKAANPDFVLPWGDESGLVGVQALKIGEVRHAAVADRLTKEAAAKESEVA